MPEIQDIDHVVDDAPFRPYPPVPATVHQKITAPVPVVRRPRPSITRPLIAWVSVLLMLLCVTLAVVTGRANGLLVLATIFLAVWVWAIGAHRRSWWVADQETSRRLTAVDAELDMIGAVRADLRAVDSRGARS